MSIPKPPFHTVSEELLYNIYLKIQTLDSLKESDINTLAKLNALLTDGDLMKSEDIVAAINAVKGNVPDAGNTLEKLFNIVQGLTYLKAEDIDTLAELNAILSDADLAKSEDLTAAVDAVRGSVPDTANTLEKLFNIIQGLTYLKSEDIDTLAELNAVLTDVDLLKAEDLQVAIAALKGNAPVVADTLEKIYSLLQPVLEAWVQDGSSPTSIKSIGTKTNFALPFITNNIERARLDTFGNFIIGHSGAVGGRFHLRTSSSLEAGYGIYIDDPTLKTIFAVSNNGRLFVNKSQPNLLVNGGWPGLTGLRNVIVTSGPIGGRLVDTTHDNVILGYNAANSMGLDPTRAVSRSVVIGSEAGSADINGTNFSDSVYIGYHAGFQIELNAGSRNTLIGGSAGAVPIQGGNDNTLVGYDAQSARSNLFSTLLGSGTKAYNALGDLTSSGNGQSYMTAIGAGAVVRTPNTIVLGRAIGDQIVVGAERSNYQLPGTSGNQGFNGYKLQVIRSGSNALGVSGSALFRDGNVSVMLGEEGNAAVKNSFRINSYLPGYGGFEFQLSGNNTNATLELTDSQFGGTKPEMVRLSPGGNAQTAILVRPNDTYHTSFGYKYLIQGVNPGVQNRFITGFHGEIMLANDDSYPNNNRSQIFAALATVTNHFIDGYFADIRATNQNAQAYAFRSLGSRILFDGNGMTFPAPVTTITTDSGPHAGATNQLLNGSFITSSALYVAPYGSEKTGIILTPGHSQANGMFIGSQQALASHDYNGYLLWLQYSTNGNNMAGGTNKPMLLVRKHNAVLNGFDHTGAFIRMEENIGSTGPFLEALKYDVVSNSLKLKFSVDKDGVLSVGQVVADPASIAGVGRLYFLGEDLKFVTPTGTVRTVKT